MIHDTRYGMICQATPAWRAGRGRGVER